MVSIKIHMGVSIKIHMGGQVAKPMCHYGLNGKNREGKGNVILQMSKKRLKTTLRIRSWLQREYKRIYPIKEHQEIECYIARPKEEGKGDKSSYPSERREIY